MSVPATTGDWKEFDADSASDNPNPRFRPRNHREPTRTRKTGAILWPMPRPFPLVLLASCTIALAGLSACDSKTGGFAPSPAPVEPPAQDISAAKDPKFRPIVEAILAQRKASKELAAFRSSFGAGPMDEAGGKKYGELFAKVAAAGDRVGTLAVEGNFEGEDKRIFELITSLTDAQLESLLK